MHIAESALGGVELMRAAAEIGERAFYDCSNLTSATVGSTATSIGYNAFRYCYSLTELTVPFVGGTPDDGNGLSYWFGDQWNMPQGLRKVTVTNSTTVKDNAFSGMSNLEQLWDNLGTFADADGLSPEDMNTLLEAGALFRKQIYVPCTECRYCTSECPQGINIPAFMKLYNSYKVHGPWALSGMDKIETQGQPGDCIACGACMGHCPQDIEIPRILAELAEAAEK